MTTKIAINLSYEKPWFWFYSDEGKEGDPIVLQEAAGQPPRQWNGKIAGVSTSLPGAVLAVFEETHFYSANAAVSPSQPDLSSLPSVLTDDYLETIEVTVTIGSLEPLDATLIIPKPGQRLAAVQTSAKRKAASKVSRKR